MIDPEPGANIVDLGLVYDVQVIGTKVFVTMTLTTPLCPMNEMIPGAVRQAVGALPDVRAVEVDLVWTPPWGAADDVPGPAAVGVTVAVVAA